jgi:transcriptional regulator with XRE-family HTH domain
MSQEALADLVECHPTYVGTLKRRQGSPSLAVVAVLADALNVEVGGLLAWLVT